MRSIRTTLILTLALALAACSGEPSGSSDPSGPTLPPGEATSFKVAFTTVGYASVPLLAALDDLRDQGYSIEVQVLDESDLAIEGVSRGDFAISSAGAPPIAIAQGANLRVFTDRNNNEFTLYATKDVTECAGLSGKRLAIHSEGATSTFMVRHYIDQTCPDATPDYLTIPGSPSRYAALIADQIDASPLELSEAIQLEHEAGDRYHMVTSFAESLPFLHNANVYANTQFLEQNPETIKRLIRAQLEHHRLIDGDPAYLKSLVEEYWDEAPTDTLDAATERYVELGLFRPDGGIDLDLMQQTIDFYRDAGVIEGELSAEDVADFSLLEEVRAELGLN